MYEWVISGVYYVVFTDFSTMFYEIMQARSI